MQCSAVGAAAAAAPSDRLSSRPAPTREQVPGLLELRDPAACLISFLLPLEPRTDLLPF